MPTLIDERIVQLEWDDLLNRKILTKPASPAPRSPGVHLSGVLVPLGKQLKKCNYGDKFEDEYPLIMGLGLAWEEFAASFYPDMDWQPGELCVEDVWMTCDGISFPELRGEFLAPVLEEFKSTYKCVRNGAEFLDEWYWQHQARAYCYGYGPRFCRWHVCHLRGDYKTFGPVYKQYVVEFSDRDCEQTWEMVKKHRYLAVAEG